LKSRNTTLEKVNELNKQKIKNMESCNASLIAENEKLKAKITDQTNNINILKNKEKQLVVAESVINVSNINANANANKDKEKIIENKNKNKFKELKDSEVSNKSLIKKLCNFSDFTINQTGKHLNLLSDKIQLGECI